MDKAHPFNLYFIFIMWVENPIGFLVTDTFIFYIYFFVAIPSESTFPKEVKKKQKIKKKKKEKKKKPLFHFFISFTLHFWKVTK